MLEYDVSEQLKQVIIGQIYALEKWCKENVSIEPEQCRKNLQTMTIAYKIIKECR